MYDNAQVEAWRAEARSLGEQIESARRRRDARGVTLLKGRLDRVMGLIESSYSTKRPKT